MRKLNEIDTNIPIAINSIINGEPNARDARKFIWKRLKQPKLITPSKGCENNVQRGDRVGVHPESPKLPRGRDKDEPVNKSVLRRHMKTCDRKYRKTQTVKDAKLDSTLDITASDLSSLNVTVVSPDKFNDECNTQTDDLKEKTVDVCDPKELRILFACDYFEDIVEYEFEREKQFKLSGDYCKKYDIDPARREILIDWLISVQLYLKAGNATLHMAVALLDILLDKIYIPCEQLQVSAIAAFWVAFKFIEGNLSVTKVISLCEGSHGKDMFFKFELLVLKSSSFLQIGGSMATFFMYFLFKAFGVKIPPEVYYCGQYFLEVMLFHFDFIGMSACERAVTAVYTALAIFDKEFKSEPLDFSRFITRKRLNVMCYNLTKYLQAMYRDEEFMRSSNLFKKYKSSRYFKISVHKILREFIG